MSIPSKTITLTSAEIATLIRVVECQYDISDDTVCDDIYVSTLDTDSSWCYDKIMEVRKSTDERINILTMLVHVLATLKVYAHFACNCPLTLSEKDMSLLYNEIDLHLAMLDDMLPDNCEDDIRIKVKHIVNISLIHQRMK